MTAPMQRQISRGGSGVGFITYCISCVRFTDLVNKDEGVRASSCFQALNGFARHCSYEIINIT